MALQGGYNPQRKNMGDEPQFGPSYINNNVDKQLQRGRNPMPMMLNPAQIRAIKNAPKGKLPPFIEKKIIEFKKKI